MLKTVLPKDQWPTYEEDREKGRYNNFALKSTLSSFILFSGTSNPTSRKYRQRKQRRKRGETKKVSKSIVLVEF